MSELVELSKLEMSSLLDHARDRLGKAYYGFRVSDSEKERGKAIGEILQASARLQQLNKIFNDKY